MTNNNSNLFKNLIGNLSTESFFSNYWAKEVLYLQKKENPAVDFPISVNDLDDYFTNVRLKYPWVKLVKKGVEIPLKEYRNKALPTSADMVDNEKLFEALTTGATIVANSIDKLNGEIGIYCRQLEKELSLKVWANVYISSSLSSGFGIHQDAHDIFIVQLAGSKKWDIYPKEEEYTGPRQPGPDDKPEHTFYLKKGELIYLPKNCPHMASAMEDPSVHLAISMEGLAWLDLIESFAKKARQDPDFRQRVPLPIEGDKKQESFVNEFQRKWEAFSKAHQPLDFVNELNSGANYQGNHQKHNRLSDWLALDDLDLYTTLQKRPYVAHQLTRQGKKIHLKFHNKKRTYPFFIGPLLEQLLQEEPYQLVNIEAQQSESEKIAFAKKLVNDGILTVVEG
jgi:ribosomal protein L16 Arg81 hydroxylase